jgi:uridine kinase
MGYYEDSFDHVALRAAVLAAQGLAIVDGIFLFRPELDDLWTFRIFVHVELEESIRRGVERDGAARELYRRRYAPGQRLYLHVVRPAELADVILDNSDPDEPRLSPGGADRRS